MQYNADKKPRDKILIIKGPPYWMVYSRNALDWMCRCDVGHFPMAVTHHPIGHEALQHPHCDYESCSISTPMIYSNSI